MFKSNTLITLFLFLSLPFMLLSDRAHYLEKDKKNDFVIGDLFGQLGNQMFQIATTISYSLDYNVEAIFPDLAHSKLYGIPTNAKEVFYNLNASDPFHKFYITYWEKSFTYSQVPSKKGSLRLHGHFQSWKYFDHHKEYIQKLFAPSPSILTYLHNKFEDILLDEKSVAIHVRTYSKASDDPNLITYVRNGRDYVSKAVKVFPEDYNFYIFSDDIAWCKENLAGVAASMRFIEDEKYIHDFYLQSLCRHHIISNSTFSWWAAYLNANPNKIVVAPDKWFQVSSGLNRKDMLPDDWIVICD